MLGVADDVPRPDAIVGTDLAVDEIRRRIYDLTQPRLTVSAIAHEHHGRRPALVST